MSEENINGQRKFTNKVWNAASFVIQFDGEAKKNPLYEAHLKTVVHEATKHLDKYQLKSSH